MVQGGEDRLGGFGAGAIAVVMEQADEAGGAERQRVMGIGAVEQEDGQAVAVERVGLDDGRGGLQVGMGFAELLDVGDGAGPEAIYPVVSCFL